MKSVIEENKKSALNGRLIIYKGYSNQVYE
jgi:hypothetical protein